MHWLPLVAMVIASALPFPHNPASRIAAATAEPGPDDRREHRHDPAARLAAPPLDYGLHANASHADYSAATVALGPPRRHRRRHHEAETPGVYPTNSNSGSSDRSSRDAPADGGALGTEDDSRPRSLPEDYKADGAGLADFSDEDFLRDWTRTSENHDTVGPAVTPNSRGGPTAGAGAGAGPEGGLTLEAGLGLEGGLDGVLEGDGMFLDAHPRVLFSPSPSPPEHPPLLLMLETGLLEEDGEREEREEREDADGHIEGHGDRAIDRSATPSWADVAGGALRPVKRDKRSHAGDRRRGEKSVCESESTWITNKKTAIDSHGQKVTVLQEIQTQTGPLKQYFYETRCRQAELPARPRGGAAAAGAAGGRSTGTGVAGAGCLGVDKRQWLSECKAKQSFVRALTKDANSRIGWRWIRIDSSCVCVLLSRTNQQAGREVLTGRGNG